MDLRRRVGRNVRRLRVDRNLTQEQLADKTDLDQRYISQLETGQRNPTLTKIDAVAKALKVDPVDLFADEAGTRPKA